MVGARSGFCSIIESGFDVEEGKGERGTTRTERSTKRASLGEDVSCETRLDKRSGEEGAASGPGRL